MRVTVAYSPAPRQVREWTLDLHEGATAAEALAACGLLAHFPDLAGAALELAVWGRALVPGAHGVRDAQQVPLRDLDRLEVLRPLRVDPKVARRERFQKQGTRAAGLFERRKASRGG